MSDPTAFDAPPPPPKTDPSSKKRRVPADPGDRAADRQLLNQFIAVAAADQHTVDVAACLLGVSRPDFGDSEAERLKMVRDFVLRVRHSSDSTVGRHVRDMLRFDVSGGVDAVFDLAGMCAEDRGKAMIFNRALRSIDPTRGELPLPVQKAARSLYDGMKALTLTDRKTLVSALSLLGVKP